MAEYAEHFHSPDGELRCYEPSAASGTGWGTTGVPDHRSNQRKACAAGERRVCTFRRDRAVDGAYGVCDV